MNIHMTKQWNDTVSDEDTIYFLGDFSLSKGCEVEGLVNSLSGKKHFIVGNHDKSVLSNHRKANWLSIKDEDYIQDDSLNMTVWINHYPYEKTPYNPKYARPEALQPWDIALCGHVHDKFKMNEFNCINVGGDVWDFQPQTLQQLIKKTQWSGKIKI